MSKVKFNIGPAARHCMKKTSPYSTLLLDLSRAVTSDEVSELKLVMQTSKFRTKRQLYNLKNSADVFGFLDEHGFMSESCTHFLEHLMVTIGRKDLENVIIKYNERRRNSMLAKGENTVKKEALNYTKLRELKPTERTDHVHGNMNLQQHTAVKEVYQYGNYHRSNPDGASNCSAIEINCYHGNVEAGTSTYVEVSPGSLPASLDSSPMAVDSSQDSLKSSITDEQKIEYLCDKVLKLETEYPSNVLMSSQ